MDTFRVSVSLAPDRARIVLEGELDVAVAASLEDQLTEVLDGRSLILFDLTELTFCDSSGLRVLLNAAALCRAHDATMRIVGARGPVRRLFELTHAMELLHVDDVAE